VNDSLIVRILQGGSDLRRDLPGIIERQRPLGCFAFDQFHGQRALFDSVDLSDVGVIQRRQNFRFALESCHALGVAGKRFGQDLESDVALQLGVACAVNLAHSARTDGRENLIQTDSSPDRKGHGALSRTCG
jgi:hypothetical protein